MPVYKRKYRSGKVVWRYIFDAPGSSREDRHQIEKGGFKTKREAEDAEAQQRIEEQQKYEQAKLQAKTPAPAQHLPQTLYNLLNEFIKEYCKHNLSPTTTEGYQKKIKHLSKELLDMPYTTITPLHFRREWNRMLECGGYDHRKKEARPLSKKTVRNVASVVSSAYEQAINWQIATSNPVSDSAPPTPVRRKGLALMPTQTTLLREGSASHPVLPMILEFANASGCRRGEVLALRWSDLCESGAWIEQALIQTKEGLFFKPPKDNEPRFVELPESTLKALADHREKQNELRKLYGPDYKKDLDLVFCKPDGSPLKPDSISSKISTYCKKLKLPKGANLHAHRHTHGSQLLAAGVDLPKVSERLGHSDPAITARIYSHALKGRDREVVERWEEYQKQNQQGTGWRQPGDRKPQ